MPVIAQLAYHVKHLLSFKTKVAFALQENILTPLAVPVNFAQLFLTA
jgi:hypothetical protein